MQFTQMHLVFQSMQWVWRSFQDGTCLERMSTRPGSDLGGGGVRPEVKLDRRQPLVLAFY